MPKYLILIIMLLLLLILIISLRQCNEGFSNKYKLSNQDLKTLNEFKNIRKEKYNGLIILSKNNEYLPEKIDKKTLINRNKIEKLFKKLDKISDKKVNTDVVEDNLVQIEISLSEILRLCCIINNDKDYKKTNRCLSKYKKKNVNFLRFITILEIAQDKCRYMYKKNGSNDLLNLKYKLDKELDNLLKESIPIINYIDKTI